MKIRSIKEAEVILAGYMPLAREFLGKYLTLERLERMDPLMKYLGNPENKIKVIHIAGTSGKTSTAYYMAGLLKQAGKKVGLTVSPHMDVITERIQINLEPLSEAEFCQRLSEFISLVNESQITPTYFELLIAFVYWYFALVGVDYAVIETGLGGLYDGTNVANGPEKFCIITDIGYDHMHVLGHTIKEISRQKAGIIHEYNQVVMYEQSSEVISVFRDWCKEKKAGLKTFIQTEAEDRLKPGLDLGVLPEFQQRNWLLAFLTYKQLKQRDKLPDLSMEKLDASLHTYVPGRMDIVEVNGKAVIMDGAHNAQKMSAFVNSFTKKFPGQKADIILAMKKGKDYIEVLPILKPVCRRLILTSFSVSQDQSNKSVDTAIYLKVAKQAGIKNVINEPDSQAAYRLLREGQEKVGIITGSIYLLSQIRANHKELRHAGH